MYAYVCVREKYMHAHVYVHMYVEGHPQDTIRFLRGWSLTGPDAHCAPLD